MQLSALDLARRSAGSNVAESYYLKLIKASLLLGSMGAAYFALAPQEIRVLRCNPITCNSNSAQPVIQNC